MSSHHTTPVSIETRLRHMMTTRNRSHLEVRDLFLKFSQGTDDSRPPAEQCLGSRSDLIVCEDDEEEEQMILLMFCLLFHLSSNICSVMKMYRCSETPICGSPVLDTRTSASPTCRVKLGRLLNQG